MWLKNVKFFVRKVNEKNLIFIKNKTKIVFSLNYRSFFFPTSMKLGKISILEEPTFTDKKYKWIDKLGVNMDME